MTDHRPAPAVQRIAETLIPRHHDHLDGVRIEYVFRDKASKKAGKTVFGAAKKVSGLNVFLASDVDERGSEDLDLSFFVVEIAEDCWSLLDAAQRNALVDHELCHIAGEFNEDTGETAYALVGHDLEEFKAVVNRHGLWEPDLVEFAQALKDAEKLMGEDDLEYEVELNGKTILQHGAGTLLGRDGDNVVDMRTGDPFEGLA